MKTTKYNLNAIAMGVALAMGSVSALAANPVNPAASGLNNAAAAERASANPTFEPSERTGIALVESSLSLIAARTHIDPVNCAEKVYKLDVDATGETEGTATIDDFAGGTTVLQALLTEATLGAQVDVTAKAGAKLYDAAIKNYTGDHQWSRKNNIFLDHATWIFVHPQSGRFIPYDEHSVKDYFERIEQVTPPMTQVDPPEAWEFDWGFEIITKKNFPVAKWTELSWYRQQDGSDGIVEVQKELLAPNTSKALCRIVYQASGFFPFEFTGTVTVSKQ
ncbi:MAG: hypothetical protein PHF31_15115 [Methylobacter sp.]|nr:hypothetical protein [Methylobacter sp.]